jgi:hypothetical protein
METPIDNVLSEWKKYLTNISSNLMELSDQIDFQLIKSRAKDTTNGYTGMTKLKADQCVEVLGRLWRYFALLSEVIDKANNLYSRNSFLNNTENEVKRILESSTIIIETERIAINDRNLLGTENNEKKATPKELLNYMQHSFEELCKIVVEISKASENIEVRLNNIKVDINKLNSTAKNLGVNDFPIFNTDKIIEIERDPLQGAIELDKLVYSIEKYRASIKILERDYNNIIITLNKIKEMLSEISELSEKSKYVIVEAQKVFGSTKNIYPIISKEVLLSLQDWLTVLEGKLSLGNLKAVTVGTAKLEKECLIKLNIERENYIYNSREYNEWVDLKGQFKALTAKLQVLKAKGVLFSTTLNEIIRDAELALYANIVDLDKCRILVRKFEQNLKY